MNELDRIADKLMMDDKTIWNRHNWRNRSDIVPSVYLQEVKNIVGPYVSLNRQEKEKVKDILEWQNHHSLLHALDDLRI